MEVAVNSVENITPSLPVNDLKPFSLCLIDQLTPSTYSPLIFFYHTKDIPFTTSQITTQIKLSLSKTLNSFYPMSGRVKDNLFIHEFDRGVPCFEARVKGQLSNFLKTEMHDQLLPFQPFCQLLDKTPPQLALQVNIFDCKGIALGLCFSHKIFDGITISNFVTSWAANARGSYDEVMEPNLFEASTMFPPLNSLPPHFPSLIESIWFRKCKYRTRQFVFEEKAIAELRSQARIEFVENPTRVEVLSAFIWRSTIKACKTMSGSQRPSVLHQYMNIRTRTKPQMSRHSIGNLIYSSTAVYNLDETELEMKRLVGLERRGIRDIDSEYLKNLTGEKGNMIILKDVEELVESWKAKDMFFFSSWHRFGLSEIDFGWGKPDRVGLCGDKIRDNVFESIILKDVTGNNNAMEAWLTIDDRIIDFLEHDPEFLAFAS